MVEEYSYKLPKNSKKRIISKEDTEKVIQALKKYMNRPTKEKKGIVQIVLPFIQTTLGFKLINPNNDLNRNNIPTNEKNKVLNKIIELIDIISSIISENKDIIGMKNGNKNYIDSFISKLSNIKKECKMQTTSISNDGNHKKDIVKKERKKTDREQKGKLDMSSQKQIFYMSDSLVQEIDWDSFIDNVNDIDALYESGKWKEMEFKLYELITRSNYFEAKLEDLNDIFCIPINNTLKANGCEDTIWFSELDLRQQYLKTEKQSEAESVANVMYLSNILARILMENTNKIKPICGDIEDIKKLFFDIKREGLRKLFQIRMLQENSGKLEKDLMIDYVLPENMEEGLFYVAIPGYFEPFVVQCKGLGQDMLTWERDVINFFRINKKNNIEYLWTHFPIKIDADKEKVLDKYLETTKYRHDINYEECFRGVSAYSSTQLPFDPNIQRYFTLKARLREIDIEIDKLEKELNEKYVRNRKDKVDTLEKKRKYKDELMQRLEKLGR